VNFIGETSPRFSSRRNFKRNEFSEFFLSKMKKMKRKESKTIKLI